MFDEDRPRPIPGDAMNLQLRRLHLPNQFDAVTPFDKNPFRAFGSEIRKHLSSFRLNHEAMSENVSHLTGQASCLFFVVHVALRERVGPATVRTSRSRSGFRQGLQPMDHLQGEIAARLHRLLVGAFDVNQRVAALQAEMRRSFRRGRRPLTSRTRATERRRRRRAVHAARLSARTHGWRRCAGRGRSWRRKAGRGWGRRRDTWSGRGGRLSVRLREGASS
jgi:hypothetical protein